jgi:hypothetical protein
MAVTESKAKAVGTVSNGKETGADFVILPVDNSPLFRVGFEKGGVVPKELTSLYTSKHVASQAIEGYIAKRG